MPKTSASASPSSQKPSFPESSKFMMALNKVGEILLSGKRWTVTLFIAVMIVLVIFELTKDPILIESFDVPEGLGKRGYTGRVIANKLKDQLVVIQKTSDFLTPDKPGKGRQRSSKFTPTWAKTSLDLKVPGAGISITSLIEYMASFFGRSPKTISGEIIADGNGLRITTRVSGKFAGTRVGQEKNLEPLLLKAAEDIYKLDDPPTLGYYYYANGDTTRCLEMIAHCLKNETPEDDGKAYALWGIYLEDQGEFAKAISKYRFAIDLDPKDVELYTNLAATINVSAFTTGQERQFEESLATFEIANDLDPNNTDLYINWAWALQEQGKYYGKNGNFDKANVKYDEAIAKYKKAIKVDPRNAWGYFNLSGVLEQQGKTVEAITKLKQSVEIDHRLENLVKKEISRLQKKHIAGK